MPLISHVRKIMEACTRGPLGVGEGSRPPSPQGRGCRRRLSPRRTRRPWARTIRSSPPTSPPTPAPRVGVFPSARSLLPSSLPGGPFSSSFLSFFRSLPFSSFLLRSSVSSSLPPFLAPRAGPSIHSHRRLDSLRSDSAATTRPTHRSNRGATLRAGSIELGRRGVRGRERVQVTLASLQGSSTTTARAMTSLDTTRSDGPLPSVRLPQILGGTPLLRPVSDTGSVFHRINKRLSPRPPPLRPRLSGNL